MSKVIDLSEYISNCSILYSKATTCKEALLLLINNPDVDIVSFKETLEAKLIKNTAVSNNFSSCEIELLGINDMIKDIHITVENNEIEILEYDIKYKVKTINDNNCYQFSYIPTFTTPVTLTIRFSNKLIDNKILINYNRYMFGAKHRTHLLQSPIIYDGKILNDFRHFNN